MSPTPDLFRISALGFYSFGLHLYPHHFRLRYTDELMRAAHAELQSSANLPRTLAALFADLVRSALREHWRAATGPHPGYVSAFALFFTAVLAIASVFGQQVIRRGADRQPTRIVTALGAPALATDITPRQEISSPAWLQSTSAFLVLYDATGRASTGNATFHGTLPQPPSGIFNTIRTRGLYHVTWQPQPCIRVALTGRQLPSGGFALAGQSLQQAESRTAHWHTLLLFLWAAMLGTCAILVLLQSRRSRRAV